MSKQPRSDDSRQDEHGFVQDRCSDPRHCTPLGERPRTSRATEKASCTGGPFCSGLGEPVRKSDLRLTHPSLAVSLCSFLANEGRPGPEPQVVAVEYASKRCVIPARGRPASGAFDRAKSSPQRWKAIALAGGNLDVLGPCFQQWEERAATQVDHRGLKPVNGHQLHVTPARAASQIVAEGCTSASNRATRYRHVRSTEVT